MRNKLMSLCLLLVMLVTMLLPLQAFAAYDKELETAIARAKTLFNISDNYNDFTYNINKNNDKTVFNLNWNDTKNKMGSVNVAIESTGKVVNYYSYVPYDNGMRKKLPNISKSDAQQIANEFIKRVDPSSFPKLKFTENNYPTGINDGNYQFMYVRIENNVPFPENNVNISVDGIKGQVQSYNSNWNNEVVFPDTSGVLSLEKAQNTYENKLGMKLVYRIQYGLSNPEPFLVYSSVYNNSFLDAKTGEVVVSNNYFYGYGGYGGKEMGGGMMDRAKESNNLTPKEQQAVKDAANVMDEQKAEETARRIMKIGQEFKLNNINLYNSWQSKDDYIWGMDFGKPNTKDAAQGAFGIGLSLDAKTGDVMSFYKSTPYDSNARVKYSEEQCLKIAKDFIAAMQPEKFKEVERNTWGQNMVQPYEDIKQFTYNFTRKVNEAYFIGNGMNVTVDNTTGTVSNYDFTWYKKELPSTEKAMSASKANEIMFDKVGIQLQYISILPANFNEKMMPPNGMPKTDIKLVYGANPQKPANIDPFSGELLTSEGKPYISPNVAQYTDIKGNFAETKIKLLAEYGISLPGTKLVPNQNITQKEFLFLLQKAANPYITVKLSSDSKDEDDLYRSLMEAGIVKEGERAPRALVARQDAVKFIIRALNLEKVATVKKDIFKVPFKDAASISKNLSGYLALAYGMNIMNGNNGYCSPKANVTKAQTFVLIYNFLNV